MRYKHSVRKSVNLILVATMSLCLTVVRPAHLYAGECEEEAYAAYNLAYDGYAATGAAAHLVVIQASDDYLIAHDTAVNGYQDIYEPAYTALQNTITGIVAGCAALVAGITLVQLECWAGCLLILPCVAACDAWAVTEIAVVQNAALLATTAAFAVFDLVVVPALIAELLALDIAWATLQAAEDVWVAAQEDYDEGIAIAYADLGDRLLICQGG